MNDENGIQTGNVPEQLQSLRAFLSASDCIEWLKLNGYNPDDFIIQRYKDNDIKNVVLLDAKGRILPRIEDISDDEIEDMITDQVLLFAGSIDNLHATQQSYETDEEFLDRVYTVANDEVMFAIGTIEESGEFNFQSYVGNPETEWYDEVRDNARRTVMLWMLENSEMREDFD